MSVAVQESLLDLGDDPVPGPVRPERVLLARGAWVDVQRGWLAGSAALFTRLAERVPWRAERRRMYDRTVDVPRLLCFYGEDAELPDPALEACRDLLSEHYRAELGEPFRTAGLCLYRDGRDSVAWHGDTLGGTGVGPRASRAGRGSTEDTMVAIVSLGTARPLLLRPRGGNRAGGNGTGGIGAVDNAAVGDSGGGGVSSGDSGGGVSSGTLRYQLGHGDLLVMGGSCQRTWEHAVPKSARPTGPRISVQFRPRGVR
jgi:alkylated DNA repair dioxygenase AlkB